MTKRKNTINWFIAIGAFFTILASFLITLAIVKGKNKHKDIPVKDGTETPRRITMREIENHFEQEVKHDYEDTEAVVIKYKDYSWLKSHLYEVITGAVVLIVMIIIVIAAIMGNNHFNSTVDIKKDYEDSLEKAKYQRIEGGISAITDKIDSLDKHSNVNVEKVIKTVKGQKKNKK